MVETCPFSLRCFGGPYSHRNITPSYHHTTMASCHPNIRPSYYHTIIKSYNHTITPAYHHTITPSYHHTITPSHHHTIIPSYHHAITPTRFFSLSPAGCTHLAALLALLRRHVAGSAVVGRSDFDSRVRCRDFVGHLAARLWAKLPHCLSSTCRRNKYEILKKSWG